MSKAEVVDEVVDSEVTKEEVVQATEDPNAIQYEIVPGDIDGVKCKAVRSNGNVLFTVSEGFDDSQVQEVFNLANKFFNDGLRFGIGQTQANIRQAMGINEAPPAPPVQKDAGGEAQLD